MEIFFESIRLAVSIFTLKCQCFAGDTLVSTVDGEIRIDEIQTGDYIWSYDTKTGERVEAKVTNVSVTETDILVHVYTDDGEEIKTTMFHPFYVKNVADDKDVSYNGEEWKAASNLSAGDELLTEDGKIVHVREVRIERLEESIKVYNLEVEGLHTYYVGEGVLVHNMCVLDGNSRDITNFDTNRLTRSQQTAIRTADNIINDHLKKSDLSGDLCELKGYPIPKESGGYWNYIHEVKDAYVGLIRAKKH